MHSTLPVHVHDMAYTIHLDTNFRVQAAARGQCDYTQRTQLQKQRENKLNMSKLNFDITFVQTYCFFILFCIIWLLDALVLVPCTVVPLYLVSTYRWKWIDKLVYTRHINMCAIVYKYVLLFVRSVRRNVFAYPHHGRHPHRHWSFYWWY